MLYHIEGIVSELGPGLAVIDCGGIGFGMAVTAYTLAGLKTGEKAKLFVAESIGENNFDLFGFLDKNERRCFEMLSRPASSMMLHSPWRGRWSTASTCTFPGCRRCARADTASRNTDVRPPSM